jgi:hypothetical protein
MLDGFDLIVLIDLKWNNLLWSDVGEKLLRGEQTFKRMN